MTCVKPCVYVCPALCGAVGCHDVTLVFRDDKRDECRGQSVHRPTVRGVVAHGRDSSGVGGTSN